MIHFLRHADAAGRRDWVGPDRDRPLTEEGRRQARAVADRLSAGGVARILSSPFRRCVESVEPLAAATGIPVEIEAALAEGADRERVADLVREVAAGTVLCSHGDVAGDLIGRLAAEGADLDAGPIWEKGSVWHLERGPGGTVLRGRYVPPVRGRPPSGS